MDMQVDHNSKLVNIWLTNAEKRDENLRESLAPIYREYKAQHYLVAVFESGEGNLLEGTKNLLLHNRTLG